MSIGLTPAAEQNLRDIHAATGKLLRLRVSSGGCQGFLKEWILDDRQLDDDLLIAVDNGGLLIDSATVEVMGGCTIDHVSSLAGSGFVLMPQLATSTCGCGASFSI